MKSHFQLKNLVPSLYATTANFLDCEANIEESTMNISIFGWASQDSCSREQENTQIFSGELKRIPLLITSPRIFLTKSKEYASSKSVFWAIPVNCEDKITNVRFCS